MGIQTYNLTHNSQGTLKKPWEKEFIDFEFNGKHISEFGLVAVFDGDRHTFAASPSFDNETTEISGTVGQLFWGSKIKSLKRTYTLATDGMTEAQVEAFKNHFKPGQYGKFIEDKLCHRYGFCRVAEVIDFKVIPFRKTINFLGFPLSINEYKGEITITFEWDDPYSYSTINYIDENKAPTEENYNDVARAVYNNGIPLYSSWIALFITRYGAELGKAILGTMLLGITSTIGEKVCHLGKDKCLKFNGDKTNPLSTLIKDNGYQGTGLEDPLIFYNPSKVSTPAKIKLTFNPSFTPISVSGVWNPVYFNNISDDINWKLSNYETKYNSIEGTSTLKSILEKISIEDKEYTLNSIQLPLPKEFIFKFNYTNPSIIYSLNRAIQIAYEFYTNKKTSAIELEEKLREEIVHKEISKWVIGTLALVRKDADLCDKNDIFTNNVKNIDLSKFDIDTSYSGDWFAHFNVKVLELMYSEKDEKFFPYTITFDGQNSETKIQYSYNKLNFDGTKTFFKDQEEFCGDTMLSPYFNLEGGDSVDEFGNILSCHSLQFRQGGRIQNIPHVSLEYNYIYL